MSQPENKEQTEKTGDSSKNGKGKSKTKTKTKTKRPFFDDRVLAALSNAIVAQAAQDYVTAKKTMYYRESLRSEWMAGDCMRFFKSRWFRMLCDLDPKDTVERLDALIRLECSNDGKRIS